jgi:hypothetical protein
VDAIAVFGEELFHIEEKYNPLIQQNNLLHEEQLLDIQDLKEDTEKSIDLFPR